MLEVKKENRSGLCLSMGSATALGFGTRSKHDQDYCKPLLEFLSSLGSDKVILVAHSIGGVSAELPADIFPHKVAVVVFLTAFMPNTINPPAYVLQKKHSTRGPEDYKRWMNRNFPVKEVMEVKDADHMAMFSQPQELCSLLLEVEDKYTYTKL
ncbi:hypothetical protein F2Q69_00016506 [Brassica cretica]|uniref:AB hydrolase-1 domain-containing protein n=1 Tax=Brassica cretica TaxID=69181 RepID=A0A8S9R6T9_BRACR|nr:hypothetical protein F2Q69_00016506 [Brassica cretica]